jgi:hypothetical protein
MASWAEVKSKIAMSMGGRPLHLLDECGQRAVEVHLGRRQDGRRPEP